MGDKGVSFPGPGRRGTQNWYLIMLYLLSGGGAYRMAALRAQPKQSAALATSPDLELATACRLPIIHPAFSVNLLQCQLLLPCAH